MATRDDIIKIWQECFDDSREYVRMFFDRVYLDEEAITLADPDGTTVSSMLLQRYNMLFHGAEVPVSYICGAATRRQYRGQGFMSELMHTALRASAERGDLFCSLIPARTALYFFYDRFGFSTVFYTKEQRYTSLHTFPVEHTYESAPGNATDDVWEAFDRFQHARECYILHSRRDFENILADLTMDGGEFVVARRADSPDSVPEIAGMAWGVRRDDILLVTDVMGVDADGRTAALRALRAVYPDTPFLVYGPPTDAMGGRLIPRGMCRVVNVAKALAVVAAANPKWSCNIRVTDPILADLNSHTFCIRNGECEERDSYRGQLDFDVTVDVLTEIIFSAPATGEILRFPTTRPMISLMLD